MAFALVVPGGAHADSRDFADLSLAELLNETVTSASRKPTSVLRTPAAISVVTQEDLRRLGITTVPEALRFVAGMEVARINAHDWAISARGFQGQFSDKLLVMIDGRSIYELIFSGVSWALQDVMLEDLDRIEVIRGPGAALWGANAVNGVVNVITKNSHDTRGTLVSVAGGNEERLTSVRHGGEIRPDLDYRVFARYFDRDGLVDADGNDAPFQWRGLRAGFRLDWQPEGRDALLLEGDAFAVDTDGVFDVPSLEPPFSNRTHNSLRSSGGHLLGVWTRTFSNTSRLSLRGSFGHTDASFIFSPYRDDVFDLDLEHRFSPSPRQDVVWGVGTRQRRGYSPLLVDRELWWSLYTAFVQDEISVVSGKLDLIVGTKLEHFDFTRFEHQPSVRLLWTPTRSQTVWGAVSRAVRSPNSFENGASVTGYVLQPDPTGPPVEVRVIGSPDAVSEVLVAYELGYRVETAARVTFDVATFFNRYRLLSDLIPGTPFVETQPAPVHIVLPMVVGNRGRGASYGAELAAQWQVNGHWRVAADYTQLRFQFDEGLLELDHPNQQARLRSYLSLPRGWELNGAVAYTGKLHAQQVASYVRLDLGVAFHPTSAIEVGVWGQNLLDARHPEFRGVPGSFASEVPRTGAARLTWRF